MNFMQVIEKTIELESKRNVPLEIILSSREQTQGLGFSSHNMRPLQDPLSARYGVRDIDHDGIPDNIDYYFGMGQYSPF